VCRTHCLESLRELDLGYLVLLESALVEHGSLRVDRLSSDTSSLLLGLSPTAQGASSRESENKEQHLTNMPLVNLRAFLVLFDVLRRCYLFLPSLKEEVREAEKNAHIPAPDKNTTLSGSDASGQVLECTAQLLGESKASSVCVLLGHASQLVFARMTNPSPPV
jgi:hypothetical protein